MPRYLKQSVAVDVTVGPMVDNVDGFTAETALTVTQSEVRLAKNGGAYAQKNESTSLTHQENGYYLCKLDTTDTNTLGLLRLAVNESGALPIFEDFHVVTANVYDTLFSTDKFEVDVQQWIGSAPNALASGRVDSAVGAMTAGIITSSVLAADAITAAKVAADVSTEIAAAISIPSAASVADAVWDEARAGHTGSGSFGEGVASVTGAVGSVTGNVGGNVTGSVGSVAAGGITASSLAADAITAAKVAADVGTEFAEALLKLDLSTVTGEAARSVLNAVRLLRNKVSIAAGTMTVRKEDDTTSAWTAAVTTDAAADLITTIDPA